MRLPPNKIMEALSSKDRRGIGVLAKANGLAIPDLTTTNTISYLGASLYVEKLTTLSNAEIGILPQIFRLVGIELEPRASSVFNRRKRLDDDVKYKVFPCFFATMKRALELEEKKPVNFDCEFEVRNRAIFLARSFGILRPGEAPRIKRTLSRREDGDLTILVPRKGNSGLHAVTLPYLRELPQGLCPVRTLLRYTHLLNIEGRKGGPLALFKWPMNKQERELFLGDTNKNGTYTNIVRPFFVQKNNSSLTRDRGSTVVLAYLNTLGWDTVAFKAHALKGSFISSLIANGVSVEQIASLSGTCSKDCILKHYTRAGINAESLGKMVTAKTARLFRCDPTDLSIDRSEEISSDEEKGAAKDKASAEVEKKPMLRRSRNSIWAKNPGEPHGT